MTHYISMHATNKQIQKTRYCSYVIFAKIRSYILFIYFFFFLILFYF